MYDGSFAFNQSQGKSGQNQTCSYMSAHALYQHERKKIEYFIQTAVFSIILIW